MIKVMAVIKIIYHNIWCNSNLKVSLNKAVHINKEVLSYNMRLVTQKCQYSIGNTFLHKHEMHIWSTKHL